jgi:hypothetical protein
MQLVERALELDLADVARARERHLPVADDARGRPADMITDAVGQRDRLFEIVVTNSTALRSAAPQVEQQDCP